MATGLEEVRVLRDVEEMADQIWQTVARWNSFAREVVGGQLARAADSIGANIAESLGRFHYGEKLQFLYFARGSLFETRYWINRARSRNLIKSSQADEVDERLQVIARQLNAFIASLKSQRSTKPKYEGIIREAGVEYGADLESGSDYPDISNLSLAPTSNP